MRVLSVANFKGGTAKSTTVYALGSILAAGGYRVLMVDVDPQASLTGMCGIQDARDAHLGHVLGGANPGRLSLSNILWEVADRLDLAPADISMARDERGLSQRTRRESILGRALGTVADDYDVALLDTQPSLGELTVNCLVASNGVICPAQPTATDLRGLILFVEAVGIIRDDFERTEPEVIGAVLTFFDRRFIHHRDALDALRGTGIPILGTIPRSVRAAEAASAYAPITEFAPDNPVSVAYRSLAVEVERWLRSDKRRATG